MAADPTGMTPEAMRALVHNKTLEFRRGILSPSDYNGHYLDDADAHDFARAILAISHDGLIEDFENWFDQHRAEFSNPRDQWDLIMETYFNQTSNTHLSKTSKTNFTKFMADKFEATSTGTATKLQCQNCKQRFSKHFILPMYPQSLQLCDSNTYLFCWACLQAPGEQNYMVHPGPWLNNTTDAESANMEPTKNLNQIQNRPWALQSLDADYGKDFAPSTRCPFSPRRSNPTLLGPPTEPLATFPTQPRIRRKPNHQIRPNRIPKIDQQSVETESGQPCQAPSPYHQSQHLRTNLTPTPFWKPICRGLRAASQNPQDLELHLQPCGRQLFPDPSRTTTTDPRHLHQVGDQPNPSRLDRPRLQPPRCHPFRHQRPVPQTILDSCPPITTPSFHLPKPWLQKGSHVPPLGHHRETRGPKTRPLPMSFVFGDLQTICRCRPQRQTSFEAKTVSCGQDPGSHSQPWHPTRPNLGTRGQTRRPILPLPHGMARRDNRPAPEPPQTPHRGPAQRLRWSRRPNWLSPRSYPRPTPTCPETPIHAPRTMATQPLGRAQEPEPPSQLWAIPHPRPTHLWTSWQSSTILWLVPVQVHRRRDRSPHTTTGHQDYGPCLLPDDGRQPYQRTYPPSQETEDRTMTNHHTNDTHHCKWGSVPETIPLHQRDTTVRRFTPRSHDHISSEA